MPPDSPPMSAPSAVSSPQGERRRTELLEVAIDVFGQSGYAGARIDDVARQVGIRRPSVLYHFADKPTLYFAAIARVVDEVTRRILAQGSAEVPPGLKLESMVDRWVDFVIDRPLAARLLLRQMIDAEVAPDGIDGTAPAVHRLLASIQEVLDARADSLEAEAGKPPVDAGAFALILASASLVWVAGRSSVERTIGLDTLSAQAIATHRTTLRALTRQLFAASVNGSDVASVEFVWEEPADPESRNAEPVDTDRGSAEPVAAADEIPEPTAHRWETRP